MRSFSFNLAAAVLALTIAAPALAQAQNPKKAPTAAQLAARERQKTCSVEWQKAKAEGTLKAGQKWPQFWSACNTRLKGAKA